jgi:hypothetical protein
MAMSFYESLLIICLEPLLDSINSKKAGASHPDLNHKKIINDENFVNVNLEREYAVQERLHTET